MQSRRVRLGYSVARNVNIMSINYQVIVMDSSLLSVPLRIHSLLSGPGDGLHGLPTTDYYYYCYVQSFTFIYDSFWQVQCACQLHAV